MGKGAAEDTTPLWPLGDLSHQAKWAGMDKCHSLVTPLRTLLSCWHLRANRLLCSTVLASGPISCYMAALMLKTLEFWETSVAPAGISLPWLISVSSVLKAPLSPSYFLACLFLDLGHGRTLLLSIALLYCEGHRGKDSSSRSSLTSKATSSVSTPGIFSYLSRLHLLSSVPIPSTRPLLGGPPLAGPPLTIISPLCACVVEYYFN